MLLGTAAGLTAYFQIGFYVAALVSAAISMSIVLIASWSRPANFDWHTLNTENPTTHAGSHTYD
jgi:urea-proton symporter